MLIRPELAALRVDDSPQRQSQQRLLAQAAEWRTSDPGRQVEAQLPQLAKGVPLDELPALAALFRPKEQAAARLVDGLVRWLLRELAASPLGQVPLRHICDRTIATVVLARCHGASLALQAIDGAGLARKPAPDSVSFAGTETWDHVLAGTADVERIGLVRQVPGGAVLERTPAKLAAGETTYQHGRHSAQIFVRVSGVLVTLKLQRGDGTDDPGRQFGLADGRLLHQSAGSVRESRLELTAALLGRMGRSDAAPLLAAMAEEAGSPHLRWQALRECLGVDSAAGFAALTALARRAGDPLAAPAGALRAQLLETYPQLAGDHPCPA